MHRVVQHGEAASSDNGAAERYKAKYVMLVEEEGYIPHQVFNCDETQLFWRKWQTEPS